MQLYVRINLIILSISACVLVACSSNPAAKLETAALGRGYEKLLIPYGSNEHLIAYAHTEKLENSLRIYFEGDGTPWEGGIRPAKNPTPLNPLGLKLAALDKKANVYLSRPCYNFYQPPGYCHSDMWTDGRYSEANILAMNSAIDALKKRFDTKSFIFIGYSGGASIASILTKKRNDVTVLVTIAGNLNHQEWTNHFGYDNLERSLNAVDFFPLKGSLKRWHLIGKTDTVVPPKITLNAAVRDSGAKVIEFENFDHVCCWQDDWVNILEMLGLQ